MKSGNNGRTARAFGPAIAWTAVRIAACALFAIALAFPANALAYYKIVESDIDPNVFRIDEATYLGTRLEPSTELVDSAGKKFLLKDYFGKPFVLLMAYYTCDGVCTTINSQFRDLLKEVNRMKLGSDYKVLTVSFDQHDDQASLEHFAHDLDLPAEMSAGWRFARFADPAAIKPFTSSFGYKYFWSPQDRVFYHPNVFLFFTPEGRLGRVLYSGHIESKDMELALIDVGKELLHPSQITSLVVSYCYSYNYKDGRYAYNIPMFVGLGALAIGVTSLIVSSIIYVRKRKAKEVF